RGPNHPHDHAQSGGRGVCPPDRSHARWARCGLDMRAALILVAVAVGFLGLELYVFHYRYPPMVSPDSSTGFFETFFNIEYQRKLEGPQVLGVGDSRMGLTPRLANELSAETGYTFGNGAVPGATPRVWYYLLRDMDPQRNRYKAIVFGMDNY